MTCDRARARVLMASCMMETTSIRQQAIIGGITLVALDGGHPTLDAFRASVTSYLNDPDTQAMMNGYVGVRNRVPIHPPSDYELLPILKRWNDTYEKADLAP